MDPKLRYSFERICRVCLLECNKMSNLFDSDRNISEIIMTCSDIKILKNDGLPSQICQECLQQVDNAWSFKQKCGLSDAKLRNYITNSFQDPSEIEFKVEQNLIGISELNDFLKYEIPDTSLEHSFGKNIKIAEIPTIPELCPTVQLDCPLCKENLQSTKQFIDHILLNHAPVIEKKEDFTCDLCKRKYDKEFELKKHQVSHKEFHYNGNSNVCPICEEHFSRHEVLVRHMGYHLETSCNECTKCNCYFTTNLHLRRHVQKQHDQYPECDDQVSENKEASDLLSSIKMEPCPELEDADTSFETKFSVENDLALEEDFIVGIDDANLSSNYLGHSLSDDGDNFSDSIYVPKNLFPEIMKKKRKHRKRKISDFLDDATDIKIEPGISSSDEALSKKTKSFSILEEMKSRKKRKNHDKMTKNKLATSSVKLSCDECPKKFLKPQLLSDHKKRHRGERSYLCSKCGKGYFKQSHLDKHMITHTNDHLNKPIYVCPLCGKIVPHSNHLQSHMRTHKDKLGDLTEIVDPNKKVHLCATCGKSCSSRSNLAVHMRRHTGTMTCMCKICGKGYPRTTDLTLHMRQHTGERPFICCICNKGFARSDKLAIHMRTHTGERPYICSICGRSFAQSNDLSAHKKRNNCSQMVVSNSRAANISPSDSPDNENQLLLLAHNSGIEVTAVSSNKITLSNNQSQLPGINSKMKQNASISKSSDLINKTDPDNEGEHKVFDLAAMAVSNNLLVVTGNGVHGKVLGLIDADIADKQNLLLPDSITPQQALDLATASHNSLFSPQQRTDFIDYSTCTSLLTVQSSHYSMR